MKDYLEPAKEKHFSGKSLLEDERGQIGTLTILAAYAKYSERSTSEVIDDARSRYDDLKEEYF